MAITVFKIINKQTPVYLHDLVTIKNSSYSFRYNNTVNIPRSGQKNNASLPSLLKLFSMRFRTLSC
jgi:hypothetical protein